MPPLFPQQSYDRPAWECWDNFRKTHSLQDASGAVGGILEGNQNQT